MKKFLASAAASIVLLATGGAALAADEYNKVPAGDAQYGQCLTYVNKIYTGGTDKSPVRGQNKAQAWCTCMWNETPDDFKGSLAKFAETRKGKSTNAICEKYSDWGG